MSALALALMAGMLAIAAPCILPMLPVVLGTTTEGVHDMNPIDQAVCYLEPTQESGRAFMMRQMTGSVVMLNLLRFRETADYSATLRGRCPSRNARLRKPLAYSLVPRRTAMIHSVTGEPLPLECRFRFLVRIVKARGEEVGEHLYLGGEFVLFGVDGEDVGWRRRIILEHNLQPPGAQILCDIPFCPQHQAVSIERPIQRDFAIVAA